MSFLIIHVIVTMSLCNVIIMAMLYVKEGFANKPFSYTKQHSVNNKCIFCQRKMDETPINQLLFNFVKKN